MALLNTGVAPGACAIAVMAKASAPGRTKTRLVPPLTFEEAANLNTAFLQDVAATMLRAGETVPIVPVMAFGPPGSEPFFRSILPNAVGLVPAWQPDFGACLLSALTAMLHAGHTAACVLNADSPTLPATILVEAARELARPGDRAVLGPSTDGGYYLLGVKQAHGSLFDGIAWSTEVVAAQTLERARAIGLPVHILPTWYDVDDADGLRGLIDDLQRDESTAAAADKSRATRALLRHLDATAGLFARLGVDRTTGRPVRETIMPAESTG